MPMRKMTDEEYLKARGWTPTDEKFLLQNPGEVRGWFDPLHHGRGEDGGHDMLIERALTIQLARDAEEERRAWVQLMPESTRIATIGTGQVRHEGLFPEMSTVDLITKGAGQLTDSMLEEYRARFGRDALIVDDGCAS